MTLPACSTATYFSLPETDEVPAQVRYLKGIFVHSSVGSESERLGTVSHNNAESSVRFTLPDNWLCLDDVQYMADYVDMKYGKCVTTIACRYEVRRAIISLQTEDSCYSPPTGNFPSVVWTCDPNLPLRTIIMSYARKGK